MAESIPPRTSQPGKNTNKIVLVLLLAGLGVFIAAGVVVMLRRESKPPPLPPPPVPVDIAPPLVIAEPSRPPLQTRDGGVLTAEKPDIKANRGSRRGIERLGTIDTQQVNSFLNARFSQVKACYERRLKMNAYLEGKLDLNITIGTSGRVAGIEVNGDTVRDSEMLDCVKHTIAGWQFPKPEGGRVVIAKTFNFKKAT